MFVQMAHASVAGPSPGLPVVLEDRRTPGLLEAEVVDPLPVSRHDARRGVVVRQHAAVPATGKEPPLWLQSGQAGDVPQALGGKRLLVAASAAERHQDQLPVMTRRSRRLGPEPRRHEPVGDRKARKPKEVALGQRSHQ